MFTSWQTTLSGLITILAAGATTVPQLQPYAQVIALVSAGLTGVLAKDKNVTGGTVSAATGKVTPKPVSVIDELH
jgi:hypothetical protein